MNPPTIYFVGTHDEVSHHAAPLMATAGLVDAPIKIVSPAEVVGVANEGDLAVFFSEHFDRFREACVQLKANRVATLYMIDGILEWRNAWENQEDEPACPWTMRPVLADKVAVIGDSQARVLSDWGNEPKVEVVGVPRFDALENVERVKRNDNKFRVLVMTAKTPGFTPEQMERALESLGDLKNWFAENDSIDGREVEVIWRLTKGLDEAIFVDNTVNDLTGAELATVLGQVDAVISTPSTAVVESMMLGVPTAILDYNNSPQYVTAAWQITAADHISGVVSELAEPSERKLLFQQSILGDTVFQRSEEGATQRMARLLNGMLEQAAGQVGEVPTERPLEFPQQILPPTGLQRPKFYHVAMYPGESDFAEPDVIQLQAQLAHARREIAIVQAEKDQLRAELDMAHEIFAEIHKHPIAGPIVRVRQKLIDWLAAFRQRKTNDSKAIRSSSTGARVKAK